MSTLVLTAKLFAPPPRSDALPRPDLLARLSAGLQRRLTLIAAPAGYGKTSLASAWVAGCGRPVAWLALDAADNDPARFLAYLIAALQTVAPTLGSDVAALLQSSQPPTIAALLPPLLNQIAALPQPAILVLDDCHVLDAEPVGQALTALVEHLPPALHLVITARADPPLPLARLRARDQLTELRATDLRFTRAEAAAFLTGVMALDLTADDVAALEERTEGWVAGLQLAALSMQGRQDTRAFIRTFAGDHRYILDYLVDEVLQRQPAALRQFLLQTAILDHLHGPLCDAVTGQAGGGARLEALQRGNFFVLPLDDRRQWYRYHHLFADVLAAQLLAEQPDHVAELHRRASLWYEQHGAPADAIRHALAAQDHPRAADLIELAAPALVQQRQEATVLGWYKALPDALLRCRPVLSVGYAGALLACGEIARVEERLRDAERWLGHAAEGADQTEHSPAAPVVRDAAAFRRLPGAIAVYRAAQALALGDVPAAVDSAGRALDLMAEEDPIWSGAATALLGLTYWASGDLEAAYRLFAAGLARLREAGNIADAIGGAIALADIRVTQGRLREAKRIYEQGLQLAADSGAPQLRGTADMYVGLSELAYERGDLPAAAQHLQRSQAQGEHTGFPRHPYRWRVALAHIRAAQGDLDDALDLLQEAERRYVGDFFPNVRPVAARRARLWLAQGRLDEAIGWARERGLSAHDAPGYLREFEHITLARVLLAQAASELAGSALPAAVGLLDRLCAAAEAGARADSLIEILALLARAHQLRGDAPAALASLARALTLAEPEGYIRLFVDEGPAMAALIQAQSAARGAQSDSLQPYRVLLLAAFDRVGGAPDAHDEPAVLHAALERSHAFVEPLSERERAVLRLLRSEMGGPEIARALVISLHTLRTHTKHIYAKLGVSSRRAAIRRAEELGLL
ncbi:LuxR C-terminal-related transcriptional regulator [Oscillochloris sp. ZM17-4]|uniref:LuxR C-terminal-related transcriptional regulator n=1 Tax=Oscillochloris sp. ZM17-4 TaxID=2866714 RepID=UPI001C73B57D|nr:LuxR C-terminal-related transcriptional regulator [Oscillochloris sp. ZM17-4]MBX0331178.1 LuxR C-terminal-related transcriptional regulator [Oscillochloris sp. ZM17-4]